MGKKSGHAVRATDATTGVSRGDWDHDPLAARLRIEKGECSIAMFVHSNSWGESGLMNRAARPYMKALVEVQQRTQQPSFERFFRVSRHFFLARFFAEKQRSS